MQVNDASGSPSKSEGASIGVGTAEQNNVVTEDIAKSM